MPSDAEQLATIKSQTLQLIRDMTTAPKPSYDVDGQSVSWNDYLARLQSLVQWCDERLAGAEPFEFDSQAIT